MRKLHFHPAAPGGLGAALLFCVAAKAGAIQAPATVTFTGSTTLGTPTIATTTEAGGTFAVTAPGFDYPELDPPATNDLSDGFGITGRFDFLNGSGTAAELTFTATRPLSLTGGSVFTASAQDGYFGIDSADIVAGINMGTEPVTGTLASFTTTTTLQSVNPAGTVGGSQSQVSDSSETIPLVTTSGFPVGGEHSVQGPDSTSLIIVSAGDYELVQSVDIQFSGLLPGESVDIDFPTYSTINSTVVPEPTGMAMLAAAGVLLRRRRRA